MRWAFKIKAEGGGRLLKWMELWHSKDLFPLLRRGGNILIETMSESDNTLIAEFNAHRSEAAFAALVRRHVSLVFATAIRQVGDAGAAEEITQNVFVALAQAARKLGSHPTIAGWLHQTALNKSCEWLRAELRRRKRDQVAVNLEMARAEGDAVWSPLVPLLDEALLELREADRQAVMLHYLEGRNFQEVGSLLGIGEDAARKRVDRCLDELTSFFRRQGFATPALAAGAPLFALSSHTAPAGLVASATSAALAAHSTSSTLTLVKGALKIMAWTKAKTAVTAGIVILIAAGTAITVKEIQEYRAYAWQLPNFKPHNVLDDPHLNDDLAILHSVLEQTPPQVRIVPTIHSQWASGFPYAERGVPKLLPYGANMTHTNPFRCLGLGMTVHDMIPWAYDNIGDDRHTVFAAPLPPGRYDFIANLPNGAPQALQSEIAKKFGIVASWRMVETNVLVLKLADPDVQGFKPSGSLMREMNLNTNDFGGPLVYDAGGGSKTAYSQSDNVQYNTTHRFNSTLATLITQERLEDVFNLPIVDETGLTNRYDFTTTLALIATEEGRLPSIGDEGFKEAWTKALTEQLGLQLVPAQRPVRMLVVERAK
jgi:uncharacterized protein (TIGR03435 family)